MLRIMLLLPVLFVLATFAGPARAEAPQTMHFQGYLKDASGDPVDGAVDMAFTLYDAESGGTALWTETHTDVTVSDGVYSVVLGSVTPLDLEWDEQYYVGVAVASDAEMTPRMALAAAPYALDAKIRMVAGRDARPSITVDNYTTFLIDDIDVNTASDVLSIDAATGEITILKSGFYRIQFHWTIHNCSGRHAALLSADTSGIDVLFETNRYRTYEDGASHSMDHVLYLAEQDSFYLLLWGMTCTLRSTDRNKSTLRITYLGT